MDTPSGTQEMTFINESGLYNVIIRSDKAQAKPFRKWVTSEVLPSIRKIGNYSIVPKTYIEALEALIVSEKEKERLALENKEMQPKAEFYDTVTDSTDAIDMGLVAKTLNMGIGRNKLFKFLRDNNVLMRNNVPYQEYCDRGYFRVIESSYTKPDGSSHVNFKTVVFQSGLDFIRKLIKNQ